ncbi:Autotransporter secretion inner membrane protein TamB [Candidatus Nitrotoga arctica]|uniref:Autotransporter secretion inner membrane protein TamB n=1 Tax=Candidatus Nitrotoga arctica TaxID=453162 RepID=A0ABN8APJ3_9PROT|nr:Autotransporter secretion inner membrane protein TamB [Candidatus Nitrotoga arctica]
MILSKQITTSPDTIKKKRRILRWIVTASLIATLCGAAFGTWVLTTTPGLQWLLATVSSISLGNYKFSGVSGTFSTIKIQSIHITSKDKQFKLTEFAFDWQPDALFSKQLIVKRLSAREVEILTPPSSAPLLLPEHINLPFAISIKNIEINSLSLLSNNTKKADFTISKLKAALESDGQQYHVPHLSLDSEFGSLYASANLEGNKPFKLTAQAKLVGLIEIAETSLSETRINATINGNLSQLNLSITAAGDVLNGDGDILIQPFALFPVGKLRLSLDGFNPQQFSPKTPKADLLLSINLQENHQSQLAGNLLIKNKLAKALDQGGLPVRDIKARLKITRNSLQFDDLLLHLIDDGMISGNFAWNTSLSSGSANLDIKQLNPLKLDTRLQAARLNGHIKLGGNTEKQHGIIVLKDETLNLNAQFTHAAATIQLQELKLTRNQSTLTGHGEFGLGDQQRFNFNGQLAHFNLAEFIQTPESDLNAQLTLTGNLSPQPAGLLSFKFEKSQFAKQPVAGHGDIDFVNTGRAKADVELSIGSNHLRAHGEIGAPDDRMYLEIRAPVLAQIGFGLGGALNLQGNFGGSLTSPVLQFDLTGDKFSLPGGHSLNHITAQGNLQNTAIKLNLQANNYRKSEKMLAQQLNITIAGQQSDHEIKAKLQLDDKNKITLQAVGGLLPTDKINPTFYWAGKLTELSSSGALPLKLQAATQLKVSTNHASLDTTKLSLGKGEIRLNTTQWTPDQWHTQGRFTGISLRHGSDTEETQGTLELGGDWDVKAAKQLTGSLQIKREKGDWILPGEFPFSLGLEQLQVTSQVNNGILTGELVAKGKHIGTTRASIALPLTLSGSGWGSLHDTAIEGKLAIKMDDISRIGALLGDNIKSGGQLDLQAKLSGTIKKPLFFGNVQGTDLTFALMDQGLQLQQGQLDAHFDRTSLHINTFNFTSPFVPNPRDNLLAKVNIPKKPGNLDITGTIGLVGNDSRLKIKLDHLPLALKSQHWIIASGNGQANFSGKTLTLNSNITADAGFLIRPPNNRPQLADDIVISGQSSQTTQKFNINLDSTIDLGKQFYVRAAGLEGQLKGALHLKTNDQNKLTATGTIATEGTIATDKAKYLAYGQQLTVERGIVNFNGPLDDPGLNILAMRKGLAIEAGVEISGSVRRPVIRLVSTPNVSDAEKLSWIVFGRALNSGNIDTSLLLTAAKSILGGQPSGEGLTQQLSRTLGVDEISFRQDTSSTSNNPLTSQIGTVGKRISSSAYLSYERGLTTTNIGITKLTYNLTPKIKVVTQAGLDSAVDVFYVFKFD